MGSFGHKGDNNRVKEAAGNFSENNVVREEDSFQVDLRVHGVSQDAIQKEKDKAARWVSHLFHHQLLGKERNIQYVERSIEVHNQRNGQH